MIIRKIWAFIKRDIRINSSYRLSYLFKIVGMFSSLFTFFFIAKLVDQNMMAEIYGFKTDYFSFVVIGIAFTKYQAAALGVGDILNAEQEDGALDFILISPTSTATVILAGSVFQIFETSIMVLFYLICGVYLFDMQTADVNIFAVIVIIILSITAFSGIGLLSSALTLIFKRGNPFIWVFSGLSKFLGGVFFPIAILPLWVQKISFILPITHSLNAIRASILNGRGIIESKTEVMFLLIFTIVFLPLGVFVLNHAICRCKKDGSLDLI